MHGFVAIAVITLLYEGPVRPSEVGENVHPGLPVLAIAAAGEQWQSFNAREDRLGGITVGAKADIARPRRG
jgi:HlyD family secretion protein